MAMTACDAGNTLTSMHVPETYSREYYFGAAYRDYDLQNPKAKLNFYRRSVVRTPSVREPRLLDIGCALGNFLECLPNSWSLTGIDASDFAIGVARERVPRANLVHCVTPPETLGTFDIITAFDVIEHVAEFEIMLERIDDMLAPHGRFIFVVPVYDGFFGAINRRLDFDATHINKWSRDEWLALIAKRFEIESWTGIFRYLFPNKYYAHFPTTSLRRFAPGILVEVRKRTR